MVDFLLLKCQTHVFTRLKMAAVKIQHKNCLQSTLRKKVINILFAGLGWSVLGKTVSSVCGVKPYSRPLAQFFPILSFRPANNINNISFYGSKTFNFPTLYGRSFFVCLIFVCLFVCFFPFYWLLRNIFALNLLLGILTRIKYLICQRRFFPL